MTWIPFKESLLRNPPSGFTWDFEDYCKWIWIYCFCEDYWKLLSLKMEASILIQFASSQIVWRLSGAAVTTHHPPSRAEHAFFRLQKPPLTHRTWQFLEMLLDVPHFWGHFCGNQGLVNVPFLGYWTPPFNGHYRWYTSWLGDVQLGRLMTHGNCSLKNVDDIPIFLC